MERARYESLHAFSIGPNTPDSSGRFFNIRCSHEGVSQKESARYPNADTTAFMQLVQGHPIGYFPCLRIIVLHSGAAESRYWGRCCGLLDMIPGLAPAAAVRRKRAVDDLMRLC